MCGIVGILRNPSIDFPPSIVERMIADIGHRGPDDEGIMFLSVNSTWGWQSSSETDVRWSVALGSRRLSILDLSDTGHMPMDYRNGFWIVYNGEVYNFIEIRAELQQLGHTFRSSSDTEVILAAYVEWGPNCFTRFRGMWGLLIVDCERNEAILCRDRLGIKPLYLWQGAGLVAIVSEIKQLLRVPGFIPHMNPVAVADYLRTGYEDPSRSFFRDVRAVPSGTWMRMP
jgi:asparagine synthase (glutamine-hydrolysing)